MKLHHVLFIDAESIARKNNAANFYWRGRRNDTIKSFQLGCKVSFGSVLCSHTAWLVKKKILAPVLNQSGVKVEPITGLSAS